MECKHFKKMSESDLFKERLFNSQRKNKVTINLEQAAPSQSLSSEHEENFSGKDHANQEFQAAGNWCQIVSTSLSNVNAKQAWKNGTEKLSQTFNNVRTTFGVLSQRIKKSTKKRQPLINVESPVTPYTRSRTALGRTPTKLYSPFSIDTPKGKENTSDRFNKDETCSSNVHIKGGKKKLKRTKLDLGEAKDNVAEAILSNDLLQTQIGVYEFHSVANRILLNGSNN